MRTYDKVFTTPAFALGFITGIKYASNPLLTCDDDVSKKSATEFIVKIIDLEDDEDVQDNGVKEENDDAATSTDEIESPYKPKESLREFVMAHDLTPISIPEPETNEQINFGPGKDAHNMLEESEIHLIVDELKKAREKDIVQEQAPTSSTGWKEGNKKGSFKRITYIGNEKQKYVAIRKDNGQLVPSSYKSHHSPYDLDNFRCMQCLPCFMGGDCMNAINMALENMRGHER